MFSSSICPVILRCQHFATDLADSLQGQVLGVLLGAAALVPGAEVVGQASHGAELDGAEAALKVLGLKKDTSNTF